MHNQKPKLFLDYLFLTMILLGGSSGFLYLSSNKSSQLAWLISTTLAYVLWGIFHHLHAGDFHWEIIVEYLLIAILAFALVGTLIF